MNNVAKVFNMTGANSVGAAQSAVNAHNLASDAHEKKFAGKQDLIESLPEKNVLADADTLPLTDSEEQNAGKRISWASIKAMLGKLYVPMTRRINNRALSADVTLTGDDIKTSATDETSISAALSNKVSHTADYVPAMQDLHGDARGLVCTVPAAAGPEIASINAPPGVEWGTCLSLQVGDIRTLMLIDTSGLWIQYGSPSGWTDWIHIATATPPQEYDLPLAEGWTSQISGSCRYAKSQENIVFVTFKVVHDEATPASTDTMIATLPEGFWPSALVHSVCIRSDFVSSGIAVFCTKTGGIWIRSSQEIPSGAGVAGEIIFVAAS